MTRRSAPLAESTRTGPASPSAVSPLTTISGTSSLTCVMAALTSVWARSSTWPSVFANAYPSTIGKVQAVTTSITPGQRRGIFDGPLQRLRAGFGPVDPDDDTGLVLWNGEFCKATQCVHGVTSTLARTSHRRGVGDVDAAVTMVPAMPVNRLGASCRRPIAAMPPDSANRHAPSTFGPIEPAGNE